ncbi:MAG: GNAT family N-acetyltransferase [Propionicimonas sp.]|uniref:GNAT family N-acetyltransferase n=1 Tax=Propionicimonas sp. TaxID=1955623 RepID=UPI003D1209D4
MPTAPPDRIDAARGLLLRVREDDVAEFIEAAAANADHLSAFIPWGADPDYRAERIGAAPSDWAGHLAYLYAFRETDDGPVVGGFSLHRRVGPDGLEIGYWLAASHTGRGLATELAGVLTAVALGLPEIERVEIHTDEGNARSAAVPQRLGYHLVRVDEFDPRTPSETGRLQIWVTP